MSIKIGNEEFTEFNDLYNDSDFLSDSERAEIEFEVALIGKLIEAIDMVKDIQQRLSAASVLEFELLDGRKISYGGASVGMVCLVPDDTDVDDALQKADASMYRVKVARQRKSVSE